MWQRIQTVYLLIVSVLMVLMIFLPFAWILMDGKELALSAFGFGDSSYTEGANKIISYVIGVSIVLSAIIPCITVFMYKNRPQQSKMCLGGIVALLFVQAMIVLLLYLFKASAYEASYSVVTLFPLLSVVLMFLALRGIKKDEKLVKSVNRFR